MTQSEQQKIRSRLRSYERKLQQEKRKFGCYHDGAGKRYQIAPHYMPFITGTPGAKQLDSAALGPAEARDEF